ncbi:MAG: hypothetical protein AUK33_04010 [Flavobacteriaceae bacterium CG2_30_34_30]|nr:hypothetical protein [Flavobacteriia bacterium]NCT19327.1 hypothetical protein [Flavobacteriia bacterium]OIP51592.1 MAG: hypothetical protein AUK33_04010 [Flavobacteriaceae bacterium CG2_30_34_30]
MKKSIIYYFGMALLAFLIACNGTTENNPSPEYSYRSIELFNVIYGKALMSFQIDSTGRILEYVKYPKNTRIYSYNLSMIELDSLKGYLDLTYQYEEPIKDKISGCVDGVSYHLTVDTKDKAYDLENTICNDKNIVDEMVLYILNITETKNKKILFKNYIKYENILKDADSILNLGL